MDGCRQDPPGGGGSKIILVPSVLSVPWNPARHVSTLVEVPRNNITSSYQSNASMPEMIFNLKPADPPRAACQDFREPKKAPGGGGSTPTPLPRLGGVRGTLPPYCRSRETLPGASVIVADAPRLLRQPPREVLLALTPTSPSHSPPHAFVLLPRSSLPLSSPRPFPILDRPHRCCAGSSKTTPNGVKCPGHFLC